MTNVSPMPVKVKFSDSIEYKVFQSFEELEALLGEASDEDILVVNFWATWCAPCVKELPYFESFLKTNQSKKIRVLLISLDFPKHIQSRFVPFIENHQLKSELYVLDDPNENEWIDKVDASWSGTIPATLFMKGDQRIFTDQEMHSVDDIEHYIKKL